jgi:hypothetical protein
MTAQEFYDQNIKDNNILLPSEIKKLFIDFAKIKCSELKERYDGNIKRKCSVALQNQLLNVKKIEF